LYNANNISAALAIGKYFEVENDAIKEALEFCTRKIGRK
jgi:UDP-N-acetylmuramoyl-tripeptide--D-alanyl-D-alanine ligase